MWQDSRKAARIAFGGRIIHLDAHFGAPCLRVEIRIDKRDHAFKFATRNRRSSKDGFLSQADIGQIALQQCVHKGVFFNLSALLITDTLLNAMAALAMMGLSRTPKNG